MDSVPCLLDDSWFVISSFVTSNWKSFILVCKLFNSFNTESTKLIKYNKFESFKKRYPNLTHIKKEEYPDIWYMLPSCPYKGKGVDIESLYLSHLRPMSFVEAYQAICNIKDWASTNVMTTAAKMLGLRSDITKSDIQYVFAHVRDIDIIVPFMNHLCRNQSLSLEKLISFDIPETQGWIKEWGTYQIEMVTRPDITFELVISHPEILWKYKWLASNMKLNDQELDHMIALAWDERHRNYPIPIGLNPHLTWEQLKRFEGDERVDLAETFLVWRCTTFDKIIENIDEALNYKWFYQAVLHNVNLTFRQTEILFNLGMRCKSCSNK